MAIDLTTILYIIAGLTALGVGADVILNYLLKSEMVTAVDAINATAQSAINAITATTETGINAIINMSILNDVNGLAKKKVDTNSTSQQAQKQ
ncbi:pyramid forming protein [Stygiolobus rod-shaped virus]|uniref:Uncharacterized protein n=1 Tax=Stygiolobus rod-shaped virus TaxID=537009 RepID=B6EFE0_9VIRU|nr:pyramid forming protein [Stygiolobus rod-shaped virus]CAQ58475.1 hypothetical protein [Stygiolobus rod-shaped virus]